MNSAVLRAMVITPLSPDRRDLGRLDPEWVGILSQAVCGEERCALGRQNPRSTRSIDHQDFGRICDLRHRPMWTGEDETRWREITRLEFLVG